MKKFSEIVAPHFNELHLLSQKERSLAATRDALLARLISGKLPVDQLDIQLTPSMREADEALQEVAHA
jgi:type I restriction enzyme S subunit